jgi:ATP-dependent DNA helicase DinG
MSVPELLAIAVAALGGSERPGQLEMATAVERAFETGEHLVVQAGTGTGKSLAYLVPAIRHAIAADTTVVVSTATIALQRQLVDRDLPRLAGALAPVLGRAPTFAILKGRRQHGEAERQGDPEQPDPDEQLFDPFAVSALGRQVTRRGGPPAVADTGDRDELVPGVPDNAWRQVSVSARECLGMARCPVGTDCFAERARAEAGRADVVVTNHALLAIDALESRAVLPEHDAVVIDEAHDLVDRVTGVATAELSPTTLNRAVRRAAKLANEKAVDALQAAAENYHGLMEVAQPGRLEELPENLGYAVAAVRDACREVIVSLGEVRDRKVADEDAVRKQALASVEHIHETAERLIEGSPFDVVWVELNDRLGGMGAASLRVAPLTVSGLLRENLYQDRSVVLTSATLKLGGDFNGPALSVGLGPDGRLPDERGPADVPGAYGGRGGGRGRAPGTDETGGSKDDLGEELPVATPPWRGIDVGSPFEYRKQGILYVARHLPPPGREPERPEMLDELSDLIQAAGGRTLGLFSSMRGARAAAEKLRERIDHPILLQGEETLGELIRRFAADAETCLFGTLSLWQGVDVPGSACQLVVMDRIPFPRPDDPLMSARQRAVEQHGGNGFMAVAATHAALLMAQGSGRLVRSSEDRGVVAVLDPRLATARYGGFFRSSMPDFWYTTDRNQVRRSLAAINENAPPVRKRD